MREKFDYCLALPDIVLEKSPIIGYNLKRVNFTLEMNFIGDDGEPYTLEHIQENETAEVYEALKKFQAHIIELNSYVLTRMDKKVQI